MKAVLKFSLSVALTLLFFAAFTVYVFSSSVEFAGCTLPLVCG